MGAQEDKLDFHGSNDVLVQIREVNLAELGAPHSFSSPERCQHGSKRKEVEGRSGLSPRRNGARKAVIDTEERIVNSTGKIIHSHLLEGAC